MCVFSACGKIEFCIMRTNVSDYLCAGFDLEQLGPYRLSDRQEGFFGVADTLCQSDREQQYEDYHLRDDPQRLIHDCGGTGRFGGWVSSQSRN